MDKKHNLLKVGIEIELLSFKDGIGHIDKSLKAGHITDEIAHNLKNHLAAIYTGRIVRLIDERRQTND